MFALDKQLGVSSTVLLLRCMSNSNRSMMFSLQLLAYICIVLIRVQRFSIIEYTTVICIRYNQTAKISIYRPSSHYMHEQYDLNRYLSSFSSYFMYRLSYSNVVHIIVVLLASSIFDGTKSQRQQRRSICACGMLFLYTDAGAEIYTLKHNSFYTVIRRFYPSEVSQSQYSLY